MSLANLRRIINLYLETPIEGKATIFLTFLNKGENRVDIIKFPRPFDPEKQKYVYLANLEVKDSEGRLLEIIPQRDLRCGKNLLCIRHVIEPKEQKTVIVSYTLRLPVKYGGRLIKFAEFRFPIIGAPESSSYLHVTPPPNLSLRLMEVKTIAELAPSTSMEEGTSYEVLAEPPKSRGISIRFEGKGASEARIKIEFPKSVRTWLYSVLVLPFVSIFLKLLNLLRINALFGLSLPLVSLPVILSCIGALVATRVWLFYDEFLTDRLNMLYIALLIVLAMICLFP